LVILLSERSERGNLPHSERGNLPQGPLLRLPGRKCSSGVVHGFAEL